MVQKDTFCWQAGEYRYAIMDTVCFIQQKVSLLHFKQMMFGFPQWVIQGERGRFYLTQAAPQWCHSNRERARKKARERESVLWCLAKDWSSEFNSRTFQQPGNTIKKSSQWFCDYVLHLKRRQKCRGQMSWMLSLRYCAWQLQDTYHPGVSHSGQFEPLRHVHTRNSMPCLDSGNILWVGCSGCFWFFSGGTGKNQKRPAWRPLAGAQDSPDVSGLWCWITYCRKDFLETFIICFVDSVKQEIKSK